MYLGMLGSVYHGVGAGTVVPGLSGCDIALTTSTWRTVTSFIVAVDCSHSVWVVAIDVGMLGFMFVWFG